MGKVYNAAFVIPASAVSRLTDDGWEFDSSERLPGKLVDVLTNALSLLPTESYLGFDVFEGKDVKLTAAHDEAGLLEHISVQIRGEQRNELLSALEKAVGQSAKVFVPND